MSPTRVGAADALLAGRYRLMSRIAVGGMGEVWRAEDVLLGREVAVKTLKPEFLGDQDFRARFRAEARHAGRLGHPGIASVYDFGESDDTAWLVMELVDGEPLSAVLRRDGVLPVSRALDVVAQTAAALHAAHEGGVVHRDVKPGNLLVRPDGVVKVTDFGIASAADAVPLTRTGTVLGTAYYLSPEQAAGGSGSPATDVYSLGVVAYECLTGSRPFPGDNPVAVALAHLRSPVPPLPEHVPEPVRELIERALAKDPAERFATAAALSRAAATLSDSSGQTGPAARRGMPVPAARAEDDALEPTGLLEVVPVPQPRRHRSARRLSGAGARSSRQAVAAAAALLALLTVGVGLRAASSTTEQADAEAAAAPVVSAAASPSPSPTGPPKVTLDSSAYVGKPVEEVRRELSALGLVPSVAYDGSGLPVGTVSDMEPSGPLDLGSVVLLHVVPAPPPPAPVEVAPDPAPDPAQEADNRPEPPAPKGKGKPDDGKGRGKK
jgi:hypothetical protein